MTLTLWEEQLVKSKLTCIMFFHVHKGGYVDHYTTILKLYWHIVVSFVDRTIANGNRSIGIHI